MSTYDFKLEGTFYVKIGEEMIELGTAKIPMNVSFGEKPSVPSHKPGIRGLVPKED